MFYCLPYNSRQTVKWMSQIYVHATLHVSFSMKSHQHVRSLNCNIYCIRIDLCVSACVQLIVFMPWVSNGCQRVNTGACIQIFICLLWKNYSLFLLSYIKQNTNITTKELDFSATNTKLAQTTVGAKQYFQIWAQEENFTFYSVRCDRDIKCIHMFSKCEVD